MHEGQEIPHIPERAHDQELGNLLAAFGNHEAKALTLSLMDPGVIYTQNKIHKVILKAQGDAPGWKTINDRTVFNYLTLSLAPIGLVAKEVIDPHTGQWGYAITEYGQEIGVALAGYMLDFSLRHPEVSLEKFLGQTQKGGPRTKAEPLDSPQRSALTRLQILRELTTRKLPLRLVDLHKSLGLSKELLSKHLKDLARYGFISFESKGQDETYVFYDNNNGAPQTEPSPFSEGQDKIYPKLTAAVLEACQDESLFGREDIARKILANNPTMKWKLEGLVGQVGKILNHLATEGYIIRQKFSQEYQSEVTITLQQRELFEEFLSIIDKFETQDPQILAIGKEYAQNIIGDPEKVALLMQKARESSSTANAKSPEEVKGLIKRVIGENPGSSTADIQRLMQKQNVRLGRSRIAKLTRLLVEERLVNSTIDRNIRTFSLSN